MVIKLILGSKTTLVLQKSRLQGQSQSRESREIFGETETRKMAPRRDQSRGLESRLQPLNNSVQFTPYKYCLVCLVLYYRQVHTESSANFKLYFLTPTDRLQLQGHKWLPKTGWASSNVALRRCPQSCLDYVEQNVVAAAGQGCKRYCMGLACQKSSMAALLQKTMPFFRKTAECTLYNHFLSELKSEDTRDEVDPYA